MKIWFVLLLLLPCFFLTGLITGCEGDDDDDDDVTVVVTNAPDADEPPADIPAAGTTLGSGTKELNGGGNLCSAAVGASGGTVTATATWPEDVNGTLILFGSGGEIHRETGMHNVSFSAEVLPGDNLSLNLSVEGAAHTTVTYSLVLAP